jgi:hypothetical protein
MAPFQYDPGFDPFTQDVIVRGSNSTLRLDRKTGQEIWRGRVGNCQDHAGSGVTPKGKKHPVGRPPELRVANMKADIVSEYERKTAVYPHPKKTSIHAELAARHRISVDYVKQILRKHRRTNRAP